jgi:hypothetical protein
MIKNNLPPALGPEYDQMTYKNWNRCVYLFGCICGSRHCPTSPPLKTVSLSRHCNHVIHTFPSEPIILLRLSGGPHSQNPFSPAADLRTHRTVWAHARRCHVLTLLAECSVYTDVQTGYFLRYNGSWWWCINTMTYRPTVRQRLDKHLPSETDSG